MILKIYTLSSLKLINNTFSSALGLLHTLCSISLLQEIDVHLELWYRVLCHYFTLNERCGVEIFTII